MANKEQIKELEELLHKKFREAEYEAVKEFAEKLKQKAYVNNYCQEVILKSEIDKLLKECEEEA